MAGLSRADIHLVVTQYVGVTPAGDLRGFTHNELSEFLEFDARLPPPQVPPNDGTSKKNRLKEALEQADPPAQLRIVEALVRRTNERGIPPSEHARKAIPELLRKLRADPSLVVPRPPSAREEVQAALASADTLLQEHGPAHAIDRMHTALQGYMIQKATEGMVPLTGGEEIQVLLALIRKHHPRFEDDRVAHPAVEKVLRAQAKTLEALDDVRDDESLVHPNTLIGVEEARLVFSAAVLLFDYLERKLE